MEEQLSFIQAKDTSIRPNYWNNHRLKNARKNIGPLLEEEEILDLKDNAEPEEEDECMQVFLRVKKSANESNDYVIQGNTLICKIPINPTSSKNETYNKYSFTKIFGPNSEQVEIFDNVVKARLLDFINGKKSSLFTYGASGGGKTFTIVGTAEEPGLIPRVLEYLFRSLEQLPKIYSVKPSPDGSILRLDPNQQEIEQMKKNEILNSLREDDSLQHIKTYRGMEKRLSSGAAAQLDQLELVSVGLWVSFAEIYNEEIFDLLLPRTVNTSAQSKLGIGFIHGNAYIKNLSHINVSNGMEAYQVFQYGLQRLKYAETNVNSHSSRSHSIFSIKIVQTSEGSDTVYSSSFSFCDLAGAERSKKTMNSGTRLKESNSINKSLLTLDRCIRSIKESQKKKCSSLLIPFRESKLTRLFQNALLGYENLCMIVNISNSKEMLNENHNVLKFSALTKSVMQTQAEFEIAEKRVIREEVERLRNILEEATKKYEEVKEQRARNLEMEKQRLLEGSKEIFEELYKSFELKKRALCELKESQHQRKLRKLEALKRELESRKRRKLEDEMTEEDAIQTLKAEWNKQCSVKKVLEQDIQNIIEKKTEALNLQAELVKEKLFLENTLESINNNVE